MLRLYVSGASPNSTAALENVRKICDEELAGQVELKVIDVYDQPTLVVQDRILAVPTLVKHLPEPLRHLVGNLSDHKRVLEGLDLGSVATAPSESGDAVSL
ncbi:MAG: circadian clock KaiB family protein [Actinomycetes bacterium]